MPSPDPAHVLSTGTLLNERYRVEEVLGAGAFGITYWATDIGLESTVVVKELYPEEYRLPRTGAEVSIPTTKGEKHQDLIERVLTQGRLLRTLEHPHLMSVYGAFKAHNTAYLVVEHLEGASLRERLDRNGTFPETEVWQLLEEVGDGLSYLHDQGALHLDLKPANIVKSSGRYVVIDYGAGRMGSAEDSIRLSTGGFTPEYAAVEQTDDSLEKGPYTDIYALGVTAYESATGKRPPRSVARLMGEGKDLVWPDGMGSALQSSLEEALRVRPEDRPASVEVWLSEPVTVEMPGEEGVPEKGEEEEADSSVRAGESGGHLRDWLPPGLVATAVLPVLAVGVLFVGLEWGGIIDWRERLSGGMGKPTTTVDEDSVRASVSENREGTKQPAGESETKRQIGNRLSDEESPITASKNQEDSEEQGTKSEAAIKYNDENRRKQEGQSEAKRQDRARAAEEKSSFASALKSRGDSLKAEGRLSAALKSYSRAVEADPSLAGAWKARGDVLESRKELEAAIESYDRAIEEDSSRADVWVNRGIALGKQGRLEVAIESFDLAIEKDSHANAWYNRGYAMQKQGRLEAAIESYDRAIEEDSSRADAWYNRGIALRKQGRLEAAIESYDRAIEIDSSRAGAWYSRGLALRKHGRLEAAIESFDRAIEVDSSRTDAWVNRGIALGKQGRLEAAIESFDRAIEVDSSHANAWYNRGYAMQKQGRLETAIKSFDRAIEVDSSHAEAWASRGIALHDRGDETLAVESYDRACELDSEYCGSYPWEKE